MRSTWPLVPLLLTAFAVPQQQSPQQIQENMRRSTAAMNSGFRTAGLPSPNWKPSRLTPAQFAAQVGAAVKNLKGTQARVDTRIRTSEGIAHFAGALKIQDRTHHLVDVSYAQKEPYSGRLVADGKRRWVRTGEKIMGPMTLQTVLPAVSKKPETMLFSDTSRLMFQGLTDGKDAWGPLIKSLSTMTKLTVEERRMMVQGKHYLSYRLRGTLPGKAQKAFEFVVDGQRFLPVTALTSRIDEKGASWNTHWAAAYTFGIKFPAGSFTLSSSTMEKPKKTQ